MSSRAEFDDLGKAREVQHFLRQCHPDREYQITAGIDKRYAVRRVFHWDPAFFAWYRNFLMSQGDV